MSQTSPDAAAGGADAAAASGDVAASEDAPVLRLSGTPLTDEEQAAVAAVVGRIAGTEPARQPDHGFTGPRDRTLERRRRLGLWPRPGTGSWTHAAGLQ